MSIFQQLRHSLRNIFEGLRLRRMDDRTREIADVLREVTLLGDLSRSALRELAPIMHVRDFRRDEFLFVENDPGLGLYIIQRGRVRLYTEAEDGTVKEVRLVSENECFGLLSLMSDERRLASAQAMTDTRVFGFFSPDLNTLLKRNPSVAALTILAFARHLSATQVTLLKKQAQWEEPLGRSDAASPEPP